MKSKSTPDFAVLLQGFFTERLMKQKLASPHTIRSYRDTFHLLLEFTQLRLHTQPSALRLTQIDSALISAFLTDMETSRGICSRSRNVRLAAIRSFFRYAALEAPGQSAQIQRVLAIPSKKTARAMINFLTQTEIAALLAGPDIETWSGRRDQALLLIAIHTGLRLSELTGLKRQDVIMAVTGSHIRVMGKGRKERCTPLSKQTMVVLKAWMREPAINDSLILFPNARGGRLSRDGVQYILSKHLAAASQTCTSLKDKRITPHCLRHSCAMELLQSGVDRAMIALWLGHESVETTQVYLHANMDLKEKMLAATTMPEGKAGVYHADDKLLSFLKGL